MMLFDYRNLMLDDSYYSVALESNENIVFNMCKNDFLLTEHNALSYLVLESGQIKPLTLSTPTP